MIRIGIVKEQAQDDRSYCEIHGHSYYTLDIPKGVKIRGYWITANVASIDKEELYVVPAYCTRCGRTLSLVYPTEK